MQTRFRIFAIGLILLLSSELAISTHQRTVQGAISLEASNFLGGVKSTHNNNYNYNYNNDNDGVGSLRFTRMFNLAHPGEPDADGDAALDILIDSMFSAGTRNDDDIYIDDMNNTPSSSSSSSWSSSASGISGDLLAVEGVHVKADVMFFDKLSSWWDKKMDDLGEKYDSVVAKIREAKGAMSEDIRGHLETLKQAMKVIKSRMPSSWEAILAIISGFLNGFLVGMGDIFVDAINDPSCEHGKRDVELKVEAAFRLITSAVVGLFDSDSRRGMTRREVWGKAIRASCSFFESLYTLCTTCGPLYSTVGQTIAMIGVAVLVTAGIFMTGFGALAKVALAIVNIVFGLSFLWNTLRGMHAAVTTCINAYCGKKEILTILKSFSEIIGFVMQSIIMSGMDKIVRITNVRAAIKGKKLGQVKIRWDPVFKKDWIKFRSRLKEIKDGGRAAKANIGQWVSYKAMQADELVRKTASGQLGKDIVRDITRRVKNKELFKKHKSTEHFKYADDGIEAVVAKASDDFKISYVTDKGKRVTAVSEVPGKAIKIAEGRFKIAASRFDRSKAKLDSARQSYRKAVDAVRNSSSRKSNAALKRAQMRLESAQGSYLHDSKVLEVEKRSLEWLSLSILELKDSLRAASTKTGKGVKIDHFNKAVKYLNSLTSDMKKVDSASATLRGAAREIPVKLSNYIDALYATSNSPKGAASREMARASLLESVKQFDESMTSLNGHADGFLKAAQRSKQVADNLVKKKVELYATTAMSKEYGFLVGDDIPKLVGEIKTVLSKIDSLPNSSEMGTVLRPIVGETFEAAKKVRGSAVQFSEVINAQQKAARSVKDMLTFKKMLSGVKDATVGIMKTSWFSYQVASQPLADSTKLNERKYNLVAIVDTISIPLKDVLAEMVKLKIPMKERARKKGPPFFLARIIFEMEGSQSRERQVVVSRERKPDTDSGNNDIMYTAKLGDEIVAGVDDLRRFRVFIALRMPDLSASYAKKHIRPVFLFGTVPSALFLSDSGKVKPLPSATVLKLHGVEVDDSLSQRNFGTIALTVRSFDTGAKAAYPPRTPLIRTSVPMSHHYDENHVRDMRRVTNQNWGSPLSGPAPTLCPRAAETKSNTHACAVVTIDSFVLDDQRQFAAGEKVRFACRSARSPLAKQSATKCMTSFTRPSCSKPFAPGASAGGSGLDIVTGGPQRFVIQGCSDADARLGIQCEALLSDGSSLGSFRSSLSTHKQGEYHTEDIMFNPSMQWPSYMFLFGKKVGSARVMISCASKQCHALYDSMSRFKHDGAKDAGKDEDEDEDEGVAEKNDATVWSSLNPGAVLPAVDFAKLAGRVPKNGFRGVDDSVPVAERWQRSSDDKESCPLVFAHRGVASASAVENTVQAIYEAAMLGLDGVEVDVFLTGSGKDYRTSILHDIDLDRLLAYGQKLGDWNFFTQERFDRFTEELAMCNLFPTLDSVTHLARALGVRLDIELKPESPFAATFHNYNYKLGEKVALDVLKTNVEKQSIVSGFDPLKLESVCHTSDLVMESREKGISYEELKGREGKAMDTSVEHRMTPEYLRDKPERKCAVRTALADHDILETDASKSYDYWSGASRSSARMTTVAKLSDRDHFIGLKKKGILLGVYTMYDTLDDPATGVSFQDSTVRAAIKAGVDFIETDDPLRLFATYKKVGCKMRTDVEAVQKARAKIVGLDDEALQWLIEQVKNKSRAREKAARTEEGRLERAFHLSNAVTKK